MEYIQSIDSMKKQQQFYSIHLNIWKQYLHQITFNPTQIYLEAVISFGTIPKTISNEY